MLSSSHQKDGAPKAIQNEEIGKAIGMSLQGFSIKKLWKSKKARSKTSVNDSKFHDHHARVMHLTT